MRIEWQESNNGSVSLVGELSQKTIISLLPIKKQLQKYNGELNIDLSQLENVDSAGLAYLVELKQYCDSNNLNVFFNKATERLNKLIALYNAEPLL